MYYQYIKMKKEIESKIKCYNKKIDKNINLNKRELKNRIVPMVK